jgi:hypothetical protein
VVDERQMNDRLNRCKRIEENREEELGPFSEAARTPREWSLEKAKRANLGSTTR